jgi:hypothetical protein
MTRTAPTAFFIGAPKCGTSALTNFLAQHPQIAVPRVKEPNYMCVDFDLPRPRSEEEYLDLFPIRSSTRVLLDASVLNLYSQAAPERIARYAPEARILVALRDPVDVMHAWHGQMVYTSNEQIANFEEALAAENDRLEGRRLPAAGTGRRCPKLLLYRLLASFGEQLARYFALFPRDRILVIPYEDIRSDPGRTYERVLRFLQVDPAFCPEFKEVNPAKGRRLPRAHRFLKRWLAGPSRAVPLALRLRLIRMVDQLSSRPEPRSELASSLRLRLRSELAEDLTRLRSFLGEDFARWCTSGKELLETR